MKRPPPKKTKEEIFYENLKVKHTVKMAPLNKFYLEEEIQNLNKICTTKDAHVTYKTSGWKANFNKYKNASVLEKQAKERELRDKCEKDLPKKLQEQVSVARIGKKGSPSEGK